MRNFMKVYTPFIGLPAALIGVLMMATERDLFGLGVVLAAIGLVIAYLPWMEKQTAAEIDAGGVHWFWWVFWLIIFFPALIVVAIIHTGRKNRAAIRSSLQA